MEESLDKNHNCIEYAWNFLMESDFREQTFSQMLQNKKKSMIKSAPIRQTLAQIIMSTKLKFYLFWKLIKLS